MTTGRRFLGRDQSFGGYRRVFEIEDGLEIDENSFIEIERTRVYFDDVLGITYHRQLGLGFVIGMGLFAALLAGIAVIVAVAGGGQELGVSIAFLVMASPAALAVLLRLLLKVDVVTVFGKRTKACMKFSFRKARARKIYDDLTRKIRVRQQKAAPPQVPPPALPPGPPPPPPEEGLA